MTYRLCLSVQPGLIELKDLQKWDDGQVHAELPKFTGAGESMAYLVTSTIAYASPNISLVFEDMTGSYGKDGLPTGCYGSIHRNESDFSIMPAEYPVLDYEKVVPIQIVYEGPLTIMSIYKVEESFSIIYADLLRSSLKSFDSSIWFVILVTFIVFAGLLVLRRRLKRVRDTTGYSATLETFSHMIGQDITDFNDRSGKLISILMTVGFFFILAFYLSMMSTDLVVVTKPSVIKNYRDIMNRENMTVVFSALTSDINEFKYADKGSIQEEFWNHIKNNHIMAKIELNILSGIAGLAFKGKVILIVNSLYSNTCAKKACMMKVIMQKNIPFLSKRYAWISSDPEGKQHTTGMIRRQGIEKPFLKKGTRRARAIFEGGISCKETSASIEKIDVGPMMEGTASVAEIEKCLSKQINYNQPEVEKVVPENFRYLIWLSVVLLFVSLAVFFFEKLESII